MKTELSVARCLEVAQKLPPLNGRRIGVLDRCKLRNGCLDLKFKKIIIIIIITDDDYI